MQIEPIISYQNLDHSPAVDDLVRGRIEALEKRFSRITGCEVTMHAQQKKKRHGRMFRVQLNLRLPGPDLSVSRAVSQGSAQDDLILAVNRAFSAAEKAIKKRKKVMGRVEIKHHAPVLHGKIAELEPELGYGWLRGDDGRMVYFQRDSLTSNGWGQLKTGTRLRFREMQGDKGPYATGVTLAD
ncbi:MAG: HPF/RaiA family ribosome-associated protein [Sulfitobacter sp.]|jgi:ribosome-associated translation inhibitor RaiA|nr:HPF/RaiA family ribosome-associated protein [Sulfitobacter sp.]